MKNSVMLGMLFVIFSVFSCGTGGDSLGTGGLSEGDFYKQVAVSTCERGFDCDIDLLKQGKASIEECKDVTSGQKCPGTFHGNNAKDCVACMEHVTCEEYAKDTGLSSCPVCAQVCGM